MLIGVLKYLQKGPKVFKEKSDDELCAMPSRKDVVKKAKEIMMRIFSDAAQKESESQESTISDEMINSEQDLESKMRMAMQNEMAEPVSPKDKQFKSLDAEMTAFETNSKKSVNLQLLHNALLSIKPTSVSSERAFSISGTLVTKRRAKLKNSMVDDLCFSKDFLEKNEKEIF